MPAHMTMPIKIPNTLPAVEVLNRENIFIMREARAQTQDIRPLRIALVNLMPDKITTETQFARLLSNTPLQIDLELVHMGSHVSKNTAQGHLKSFYRTFADVRDQKFDGMVITGAPVERMATPTPPIERIGSVPGVFTSPIPYIV